ncbi:MAG TPA: VWA domain-containing protein [Thermoanaerobaculia bacterium]|nr:VWA domain-containing protein [Thermoanaerobaculia bacterium]
MPRTMKLATPAATALAIVLAIVLGDALLAQEPAPNGAPVTAVGPGAPTRGAEALRLFGKLEDDRALVYIGSGPPDARVQVACPDLFRALEVWTYLEHPKLGKNAHVIFHPESGTNEYRYWMLLEGDAVLLAPAVASKKPLLEIEPDRSGCRDAGLVLTAFKEITKRQTDNNRGLEERAAVAAPHVVPPKDAKQAGKDEAPPTTLLSAKPLSGKERKHLSDVLPENYKQWLVDVEPILTDLERDTFLKLASEYQREKFIEQFWKRRSVGPDGMRVAFKDIYELRIRQARERFRNMRSDQARIFLVNGPPDGLKKVGCDDIYWPIELWYYERLESLRVSKVLLLFYQPYQVGDFKLWTPMEGATAITVGGASGLTASIAPSRQVDVTRCSEWREINAAMAMTNALMGVSALKMVDDLKQGPKPDVEGVDQILLMTTDIAAGAAPLPIQRTLRFPEMAANKMRMELAVMLERQSLTTKVIGEEAFLDIDVVGEIVKGDKLIDNFRYRFDFPASTVSGPFVPLTIERDLYPGDYQLKVKVADANRNAASLISEKMKVPEIPDASLTAEERAAREAAKASITRLAETRNDPRGAISIVPLAREIATGLIRFETRTTSPDIVFTEFYLDNQRVMTKRRPPFDGDLNLGELPRRHTVKVIGYAKDGRPIAEDEVTLNEGREAFRVRIASPEKGVNLSGPTRVVADLAVPETKKLKQLEIFVNENRAAVLYQAPFQQVIDIPRMKDLGFLRVVATLEDGTSTEDIRYINAPKYLSEVNVRAVELYTSVFSHGKPVSGLTKESFRILEDGVAQNLEGFEVVTNLPLALGLGIDTSGSMEESIVEAQKAASEFLKDVMTTRDRCFLITFDNEPQLVSHFTTDRDKLAQALAGLRAQGSTALWDALVYGLYQYQGVKGRKAYVILTDGEDRSSKFPYEAALDYAKKSGVAIYFIGLRIGGARVDIRYKINKLAKETGGTVYYIESAKNLAKIYAEINEELRSQYLLSYIPQNKTQNNAWRKIEVKMTPDNLQARTISGYYP